ncbi:kinesin-like protein KIN-14B isoform X2 [Aristolochia californica]|uniref:kinesin-like protein KIN-14B isoform X2 n=1 Tax=Aristolochia californica TaxID=171875 RepID=UPI0035DBF6C6
MDYVLERRQSRKYIQTLAQSIQSLRGFKTYLTSTWAESVCHIIKALPSDGPSVRSFTRSPNSNKVDASHEEHTDVGAAITKVHGNIRVFCRVRPILAGEKSGYRGPVVVTDSSNVFLKFAENKKKCYCFDKVFHPDSTQDEVFSEVEPMIKSALDGYNVCIFAYGQTGTGKTFTMEGKPDYPGVVPRAMELLFKQASESNHSFHFIFSMLEIYMGNLRDLLVPQTAKITDPSSHCLQIKMDPSGGIEIENLAAIVVSSSNQAKKLYRSGSRFRSTASTNSNATSSRSHCLIRILVTCFNAAEKKTETSKIWMVDLGGSERLLKTQAKGRRLEEGKAINLSLSALGDVISALQRKKPHVPYRNSKLTQVLRDSLGEGSKTLMLVHVSPNEEDLCESICSLGFAARVRSIKLGQMETAEVRAKKEVKMAELQRKVEQIEYSRQDIKEDIVKLNEKLKHLTGTDDLVSEHLKVPQELQEQQKPNSEKRKQRLKLPRFMRPTVCSRQKSGKAHKSVESTKNGEPLPTKRRKASSLRAESVSFPINGISKSEYGSDALSFSSKYSADYGTEFCHDVLGYIKMVDFQEQGKAPSSLSSSISYSSHESIRKEKNKLESKIVMDKCLNLDNWVVLHKNKVTSTHNHQSKRLPAIPLPDEINRSHVLNCETVNAKAADPYDSTMYPNIVSIKGYYDDFVNNGLDNLHKTAQLPHEGGRVGSSPTSSSLDSNAILGCGSRPMPAVKMVKDLLSQDIYSNDTLQKDELVMQKLSDLAQTHEIDRNDEISVSFEPASQIGTLQDNAKYTDDFGKPCLHLMKSRRALFMDQTRTPLEDSFNVINSNMAGAKRTDDNFTKKEFNNNDVIGHLSDGVGLVEQASNRCLLEDVKNTVGRDEILMETQKDLIEPHETNVDCEKSLATGQSYLSDALQLSEDGEKGGLCDSVKYTAYGETDCAQLMQSQRGALFVDHRDMALKDNLVPTLVPIVFAEENQNKGICLLFMRMFQKFCACAFLGLGIQTLGLRDDFFHALVL